MQNTSPQSRWYDPSQANQPKPSRIELLVASDFGNATHLPAQITTLNPAKHIALPPLGIARIVWE